MSNLPVANGGTVTTIFPPPISTPAPAPQPNTILPRSQERQWDFETDLIRAGDLSQIEAFYPERFMRKGHAMFFHFAIWETMHPEVKDFGFLTLSHVPVDDLFSPGDSVLVFGSKQTRRLFRQWWKRYQRFYDDDTIYDLTLPVPMASRRLHCRNVVAYRLAHDDFQNDRIVHVRRAGADARDVWAWIVTNCRGRVWRVPGAFLFARDSDAVHFKLRWHGA